MADKADDKGDQPSARIGFAFSLDRSAQRDLAERASRMIPSGPPLDWGSVGRSVQFLRGVGSRSTFALSSFYLFLGADINAANQCTVPAYPGKILQSYLHFSALNTIGLACRKVFDHGNDPLTGATFAKHSDVTLREHAEYWAEESKRPVDDAYRALEFLRTLFGTLAKPNTLLLKSDTTLGRRIGLIKQYADRSAAHLSLEPYEFHVYDVAHVVAAIALIGEIIRSFDMSYAQDTYFNEIDEAAHKAAIGLLPDTPPMRLFQEVKLEMQARLCWQWDHKLGMQMITEQLPYAISWF